MKKLKIIIYNVVVTLLIFLFFEVSIESLLSNPKYIPDFLLPTMREYYEKYDRSIVQFNPSCAMYDSSLYYTLRPGHSRFSNREFDNTFEVNTFGFRDDEASLESPEIIVLGDSFTMGWGVDQNKTFVSLLQQNSNYKVLNTGMSSYGTAREMTLLNKINTDSLKFLIIQYCSNDYFENKSFLRHSNQLNISDKDSYLVLHDDHIKGSSYYPFKHSLKFIGLIGKNIAKEHDKKKDKEESKKEDKKDSKKEVDKSQAVKKPIGEITAFLEVLKHGIDSIPAETKIIVFSLDSRKATGWFVKAVERKLEKKTYSNYKERITFLDFSLDLNESNFYILDDHMNESGHQIVSSKIEKLIGQY